MRFSIVLSLLICGMLALPSCQSPAPENKGPLQALDHIIGTWQFSGSEFTETWTRVDESHYKGVVNRTFNGVLEPTQFLDITQVGDSVIYTGEIVGAAPSTIPIRFYLVSSDEKQLSFKNLTKDFPSHLNYSIINEQEFTLTVLGTQDGRALDQTFRYKRLSGKEAI